MPEFPEKNPIAITKYRDFENAYIDDGKGKDKVYTREYFELDEDSTTYERLYYEAYSKPRILDQNELRRLIYLAQNGDLSARDKVWEANLRVPFHVMQKYFAYSGHEEDLIQEGNLAILEAIQKFDLSKNVQFSSFLYRCVINKMHSYFASVNPKVNTNPPSKQLKKVISATELRNLILNFVDIHDLRNKISHFRAPTRRLIEEYVCERIVQLISFEENEEEVLDQLHSDTSREYIDEPCFLYLFEMIKFEKYMRNCALCRMKKEKYEIFIKVKGLFGYPIFPKLSDILDQLNVTETNYQQICQEMNYKVFEDEEFYYGFKALIKNVIEARGYFYERI